MSLPSENVLLSVLLAARNEEANIERCLHALAQLDFPRENIEIIIGDDDSTDATASIISEFIFDKPSFRYKKIITRIDGLKGKANVLAQLAATAKGKYFLFCDADIAVPRSWVSTMLGGFQNGEGVVVGLTRMKNTTLLADMLSMEWLFTLSIVRFFSLFQIPVTGLGNNMAITRQAYEAVGGYEKIGFSIIEDYALFMAIVKKGFKFSQIYSDSILAISEPIPSFAALMVQRKRWMTGVMQSPWRVRLSLIAATLLVPVMIILSFWTPALPLAVILGNYLFITGTSIVSVIILKQKDLRKTVFLFWFYLLFISLAMLTVYYLPGKTTWKDRTY